LLANINKSNAVAAFAPIFCRARIQALGAQLNIVEYTFTSAYFHAVFLLCHFLAPFWAYIKFHIYLHASIAKRQAVEFVPVFPGCLAFIMRHTPSAPLVDYQP
jgi:hypothetical protein